VLVPAIHGDIEMRPWRNYPILRDEQAGELVETITEDTTLLAYLRRVRTSEGLFSYCSACLVRRERLLEAPALEDANGTCWRYAVRLISVLTRYPSKIVVMNEALILKRGDNDSFGQAGVIRRLKIALLNWDKAIGCLRLNVAIVEPMLSLVKSDIRRTTLLYDSQLVRDREEKIIYVACVRSRLGSGNRTERILARLLPCLPRLLIMEKVLRLAKVTVRRIQQRRWQGRPQASTDVKAKESSVALR
jgi:hypothetical protein